MLQKNTHRQFGSEVPPLQFAPENGAAFFAPVRLESYRSPLDAEDGGAAEPPYVGHAVVGAPAGEPEQQRLALSTGLQH
jgi:hypothetical protein